MVDPSLNAPIQVYSEVKCRYLIFILFYNEFNSIEDLFQVPVTSSTANLPLQSRPDLPSVSSGLPVSNSQSSNDILTPTTFPASHLAETDSNSPTNVVHSAASACSAMNSGNASPIVSNNFNSEHGKTFENSIVSPQMPPHEDVTDDEAAVKSEPRSLEDFKYEPSSNAHEAISDDEEPPKSTKSELHVKTEEVKEENDAPEDVKKEEMPADVTVKVEEPEKEGNEMETGEGDGGPNVPANVGDNKEVEGTVGLKVEGKKVSTEEYRNVDICSLESPDVVGINLQNLFFKFHL